jgi:dTDP-4-amino-4,6-dideoxygalactose transaminase
MSRRASFRVLPPAAEPFKVRRAAQAALVPSERVHYIESGTAALAFVLSQIAHAARTSGASRRNVLLPAYVCPDVLSAVLFAGLRPVLVDLGRESCFPSPDRWAGAIDGDTLVVLTVGFMGLRDSYAVERTTSEAAPFQVEDCCQVHPGMVAHSKERGYVYSFGRGKPISLLHGGAAVLPDGVHASVQLPASTQSGPTLLARGLAYNVLRRPACYGWVRRLPGLGLGSTTYKPLASIRSMHPAMVGRISLSRMEARMDLQRQMRAMLSQLAAGGAIVDLWSRHGSGEEWLLRYPILLPDRSTRDRAVRMLDELGLGASALYGAALPDVDNVPSSDLVVRSTEHARQFADRLMTLPLHAGVRRRDIDAMAMALDRILKNS